jgi:hypothetical protein
MNIIKKAFSAVLCATMVVSSFASTTVSAYKCTGSSATIDNGYYTLSPKCAKDKCIDSEGGATWYDGYCHNLHIWEYLGNDNQIFYISYYNTINDTPYYTICNKLTGYYMDVSGGEVYNFNNIWEYEFNGSDAQLFRFIKKGNYYVIMSKLSNEYVLDVSGASSDNGTNVQLYEYSSNNSAQLWKINSVYNSSTTYKTITLDSFSTFDEWEKNLMYAQMEAIGFTSFSPNANGELVCYGNMIVGGEVLETQTISYTIDNMGKKTTHTAELPSKVKFKLHKHDMQQLVWFDFTNLTITQYCECGDWRQFKWEVPYPD